MSSRAGRTGVALVTGAAKRIGAAIATRLAREGYAVILHANSSISEAEAKAHELTKKGFEARALSANFGNFASIPAFYDAACEAFGPPDVLINNASYFGKDSLETLDPEVFSANLALNLQAPVLLAQQFAARLEGRNGVIINILDQRVLRPNPQFFSYSLAKTALFHATKTMAQALAPHIRVNGIGPGPTLPNDHDGIAGLQREAAGTLLNTVIDPDEIAEAVLFLARARHVTGQMIAVDSGQHLGWQTPDLII